MTSEQFQERINNKATAAQNLHIIWHFFTSVKLAIVLLLLLAATSIIGTFIPQNMNSNIYHNTFGHGLYEVLNALSLFDMYHSWWFQSLMFFLSVNLLVCSIDKLHATRKIIFVKNPSYKLSVFKHLKANKKFSINAFPENLKGSYKDFIEKKFNKCIVKNSENGFVIFGEKGRLTRLGVYYVHLSIILMLSGGLIGSFFGFEGHVNIPEGGSANTVSLKKASESVELDFEIKCNKFSVLFYDTGAPKEYKSDLVILENKKEVVKKAIIVNDPLRYKGINIFQSSYGSMPPEKITIAISSASSGMTFNKELEIGDTVDLPEGLGTFTLQQYLNSHSFRGHNIGETFLGTLSLKEADEPVNIFLPLKYPSFDKMRKGSAILSVIDFERSYYTGLQVTKDPGVPLVYTGFLLLIIGCYVTFFMSHKNICIEVCKTGDKSLVTVAGKSNKNRLGMDEYVKKISDKLSGMTI